MTNNHMRLLTEQELQSIYGGNIFTSIWNWLKNHFTLYVEMILKSVLTEGLKALLESENSFSSTQGEMQLNCISPLCHIFLFAFNLK